MFQKASEFKRDLLNERTNSGIERASVEGTRFDRPPALTDAQRSEVLGLLAQGMSVGADRSPVRHQAADHYANPHSLALSWIGSSNHVSTCHRP